MATVLPFIASLLLSTTTSSHEEISSDTSDTTHSDSLSSTDGRPDAQSSFNPLSNDASTLSTTSPTEEHHPSNNHDQQKTSKWKLAIGPHIGFVWPLLSSKSSPERGNYPILLSSIGFRSDISISNGLRISGAWILEMGTHVGVLSAHVGGSLGVHWDFSEYFGIGIEPSLTVGYGFQGRAPLVARVSFSHDQQKKNIRSHIALSCGYYINVLEPHLWSIPFFTGLHERSPIIHDIFIEIAYQLSFEAFSG